MKPAARLQAAIELVDAVIETTQSQGAAADILIARYFKDRRFAGSKDRRAIRDLVYATIRRYRSAPANGRAALLGLAEERPELGALFDGSLYGPAEIAGDEQAEAPAMLPEWLRSQFSESHSDADIDSLSGRAPLDIRVNLARLSREEALVQLGEEARPGALSTSAIRLPNGFAVEQHALWQGGLIDVQDEGSQVIADVCGVQMGSTILDLCAGAGGKTLALHDRSRGSARLIASDTDRRRLSRLDPRSRRQKAGNIETRLLDGGKEREALADLRNAVDCVLIDAPCS
ncbi:MAG: RsmB/NOP family class I SAM-dependent RNA methyltransferase, partial [Sphingomonadaceae bacterium]|nr:RsmB/NOP family class I SAM-dependent RNA methyltransferase [Sphingomonadaceae bacterium]